MKENIVKIISSPIYQETTDRVDRHIAAKMSRALKSAYEKRKLLLLLINEQAQPISQIEVFSNRVAKKQNKDVVIKKKLRNDVK